VKVYEQLAQSLQARINCERSGNTEWHVRHSEAIESACKEYLPSGSGFDCGTRFDFDKSTPNRLVLNTDFHHMDEHGGYDGWTEHQVIVTPSLVFRFDVRVTGRDRNDIKEYIASEFECALNSDMRET